MKAICVISIIICGLLMAFVHNVCGMPKELAGNVTQGEVGKEAPQPQKVPAVEAPKKMTTTQAPKEPPKAPKEVPPVKAPKETKPTEAPKGLPKETITKSPKLEGGFGDGDDNTTTPIPTPPSTTSSPIVTTKEPKKNQADKGIVMNLLNLAIIMTSGKILAM